VRWERGGAQRPALQVSELKKTGARSALARTRGQNPLVYNIKAIIDLRFDGRHPCLDAALDEAGMTHLQELSLDGKSTLKGRYRK
jgi:hypothetical protein